MLTSNPTLLAVAAVLSFCVGILAWAFGVLTVVGGNVIMGWIALAVGTILVIVGALGYLMLRRKYDALWGTDPEEDELLARSALRR